MKKSTIHLLEKKFDLSVKGLAEIGNHVIGETELYRTFMQWADQRKDIMVKELLALAVNPDANERTIGVILGKIKAMEDDLPMFFNLAKRAKIEKDKKKEEA